MKKRWKAAESYRDLNEVFGEGIISERQVQRSHQSANRLSRQSIAQELANGQSL